MTQRCWSCEGEGIGGYWRIEECETCKGSGILDKEGNPWPPPKDPSEGCWCSSPECPCDGEKVVRF